MKMAKKNPRQGLFAVLTVIAAVCLLFAACNNDSDTAGTNKPGGWLNYDDLQDVIDEAELLLETTQYFSSNQILTDGDWFVWSDVDYNKLWFAKEAAYEVYDESTTQSEIDAGTEALTAAINEFKGKRQQYGMDGLKAQLLEAIEEAEAVLDSVVPSDDGAGLAAGVKYTAVSLYEDLVHEIARAQAAYDELNAGNTAGHGAVGGIMFDMNLAKTTVQAGTFTK